MRKGRNKMAHNVICPICNAKFDRDKHPYVKYANRRYAHAVCYLREKVTKNLPELEICDPADEVICCVCKKPLHKKKDECAQIHGDKWAHKTCAEIESKRQLTEEEVLHEYIKKLFNTNFVAPRVKKQINEYVSEYNYTYSGILKSLKYYYEIKHGSIEKSGGGIGIVPYIYKDAYNYYYAQWQAQQKNIHKPIQQYIPQVKEIVIPPPQRQIKKRKQFTFLDKED